jgi:cation transport ATPase
MVGFDPARVVPTRSSRQSDILPIIPRARTVRRCPGSGERYARPVSTITPQRLQRIALVSLLIGVTVQALVLLGTWATTFIVQSDSDSAGLLLLLFLASVFACGSVAFAGNALAWSGIVSRLPTGKLKRDLVVSAITLGFVVVSIVTTFFLVLGSFYLAGAFSGDDTMSLLTGMIVAAVGVVLLVLTLRRPQRG